WPLRKPVVGLELMAVASRVPGVSLVNGVLLTEGNEPPKAQVEMQGLQLPRVMGVSVTAGDPLSLDELRGATTTPTGGTGGEGQAPQIVPVPVVPEECT